MTIPHYLLLYDLLPLVLSLAFLYGWAGVCYIVLRFSRLETPQRSQTYLSNHLRYFASRFASPSLRRVGFADMTRKGRLGWNMLPLAFIGMNAGHLATHSIILANCVLFFGGLHLAQAWYGKRCLRLLGVDSFGAGIDKGI